MINLDATDAYFMLPRFCSQVREVDCRDGVQGDKLEQGEDGGTYGL